MGSPITAREILTSYDSIAIEKEISSNIFMFLLLEKRFLLICPDSNVPKSKSSIYLFNDEGLDIPHIMLKEEEINECCDIPKGKYRYVCLYEQGSFVNSIFTFEEKIIDVIDRLVELLSMDKKTCEKEFQKEFLYYWNSNSSKYFGEVYLKQEQSFSKMELYSSKHQNRLIEIGLELSDINDREKDKRKWIHHIENDVFTIPIIDNRGILPPHRGCSWTAKNVQDIIYGNQINHVSDETYASIKSFRPATQNVILIFIMKLESSSISFAVKLKCKNVTNRTLMEKVCEDLIDIELMKTARKDYKYLNNQIGNDIGLQGKKVLLVGAGSLGSYVAFELVKNGVSELTIYDEDILSPDNTMRWFYSGLGKGENKATIIGLLLKWIHPQISVNAIPRNINQETLKEEVDQVDMIIFTIGNSDSQIYFNQILKINNCKIPILFTWLEAGGKYSHVLRVNYSQKGCYQCLFTTEQGELTNNRANVNSEVILGNNILRNGCGGTRAAYGTTVILRTVAALLDVIQKMLSNNICENTLIDIMPDKVATSEIIFPMKGCKCCDDTIE